MAANDPLARAAAIEELVSLGADAAPELCGILWEREHYLSTFCSDNERKDSVSDSTPLFPPGLVWTVTAILIATAVYFGGPAVLLLPIVVMVLGSWFLPAYRFLAKAHEKEIERLARNNARVKRQAEAAAAVLDQIPDPRALAALVGSMRVRGSIAALDFRIPPSIVDNAARLLDRLEADHGEALSAEDRRFLYTFLSIEHARRYRNLQESVLRFASRAGDVTALSAVQALAEGPAVTPNGIAVRRSAMERLPILRAALHKRSASESLLRAAEGRYESALLRPGAPSSATDPNELLRPSPE